MRLRHAADARALAWAFGLMPAVAAAHYAAPALSAGLLPLSTYLGYSAAVLAHNHNHCPVFVEKRWNDFYSCWISFFYGYPTFAWVPTHNENHHRFVNGPGDVAATSALSPRDGLAPALAYFFFSSARQAPLIREHLARLRRRRPGRFARALAQYAVVYGGHALALALAVALHGPRAGALAYAAALGAPALGALWGIMFTNYVQHVGCDPASPLAHSRNFVSPLANFFVFNNGFHTAHHRRPALHWSRLPAEHARLAPGIDPRLNERSIFVYLLKTYVRPRPARRPAPAPLAASAPLDAPPPPACP